MYPKKHPFNIYREAIAAFNSAGRGAKRNTQLNATASSRFTA
jgi:hypothetical protein